MKWKPIALVIGLLILIFLAYTYLSQNYKEPLFLGITILEIEPVVDEKVKVKAEVDFNNPNTFSVQIINTEIKAFSNDVLVASISQTELTNVSAKSDFKVPVKFNIDLLKLGMSQSISGLLEHILNKERKIPLRFEGYCRIKTKTKMLKIPIEYEDEISFK